jgi:hypothetical protein
MDCVKDDMKIKGVSMEMTSDRRMVEENMLCRKRTLMMKHPTIDVTTISHPIDVRL